MGTTKVETSVFADFEALEALKAPDTAGLGILRIHGCQAVWEVDGFSEFVFCTI